MEPSQTTRGTRWLENFDPADRLAAQQLLDSVEFVGQDSFRAALQKLLESLPQNIGTPVALIPVRELAPTQRYYKGDRNAKPSLLLSSSFPGSEAVIANLAGNIRRAKGNVGPFVAAPSLRSMRDSKCRSVVLVDDSSGSGDRILTFLDRYRDHPTVRSWESFHLIRYHVALYALTDFSHSRLCKQFGIEGVHFVRRSNGFNGTDWTAQEKDTIEELCRRYCSSYLSEYALGYKGYTGLLAFPHTAPNNLPAILWQKTRAGFPRWKPFFEGKAVPNDLSQLFGEPPHGRRIIRPLRRLGQMRLAEGGWRSAAPTDLQMIFLLLAALSRRPRDEAALSEFAGLSYYNVHHILRFCRRWGLVAPTTLHLTDEGRSELQHARDVVLPIDRPVLTGSSEFYYPTSLRVGR